MNAMSDYHDLYLKADVYYWLKYSKCLLVHA